MASSQDLPQIDLTGTLSERQFKQLKCVNRLCNHGDDLREAIELACNYYNVEYKVGKEVCSHCFNQCLSHYKRLEKKWDISECLLKANFPNFISHHVIESSSSSEDEEELNTSRNVSDNNFKFLLKKSVKKWFNDNKSIVDKHITMCDDFMSEAYEKCTDNMNVIKKLCRTAELQADKIRAEFYKPYTPKYEYLPPVDLTFINNKRATENISDKQYKKNKLDDKNEEEDDKIVVTNGEIEPSPADLPEIGPQEYPPLKEGSLMYAVETSLSKAWSTCRIKALINQDHVHVKFNNDDKIVTTKEIAYYNPNPVQFRVGSRVIALSNKTASVDVVASFFAGVVGEPPKIINKFRYLIFFDDGCVEYRSHKDIRLIVHKTVNEVWNDVCPRLKDFLQNYLEKYPERQMVKLTEQDSIRANFKNRWVVAKVIKVDASLVKLHFIEFKVFEWLYRGSLRLYKMFEKQSKSEKGIRIRQSGLAYLNKPIIEFTSAEENEFKSTPRLSTMKCSTSSQSDKSPKRNSNVNYMYDTITLEVPKTSPGSKKYIPHDCSHLCIVWTAYDYNKTKRMSMLAIPLHFGFIRYQVQFNHTQKAIFYKTPCGKCVRSLKETFNYLNMTKSKMTIDQFDFNSWVRPMAEFRVLKSKKFLNDLSMGKEFRGITCVNVIDNKLPPPMVYMTSRQAMPGVNINVDSDFLCGCDCIDDCQDKSKCACWQMTIEGQKILPNLYKDPDIGYNYRRLPERVLTGIYECNKTCKCSSSCLNRVVQFPLSQKLQLFLTEKKGWGVRCVNDIPQGSFICIYVGYLLTETDANEGGINYGDEYLAELDYIEVVEKIKEDYESEVSLSDQENSENSYETDESFGMTDSSDENYQSTSEGKSATSEISLRLRKRKESQNDYKAKKDGVGSKLNNTKNNSTPSKSMREYFGENESVYIMDAKTSGNIGRYLNHSCSPNTFVQNVFVDTHDLRFPWVSFFALHYIQAGTELTWDYSYDVGSVPGKSMKCHCGSSLCRGRLL